MASLRSAPRLLLVGCLVMSTQSLLLIQGSFVLRQDYIADKLCVNCDRPEMECDGHCVLKGRLGEHHEHKDSSGTEALALALSVVPLATTPTSPQEPRPTATEEYVRFACLRGPEGHPEGIFRPPQVA